MAAEELFLNALFAWDEFRATVRLGRLQLGDPCSLTTDQLREWLREPAPTDFAVFWEVLWDRFPNYYFYSKPGFDLFIVACCRTWIDVGGESKNVSTKLEATYLMAHRWTEWLGIRSYDVTPYFWVYTFFEGKLNPYHPWPRPGNRIRKRLTGKPDFSEFKTLVKQIPWGEIELNQAGKKDILAALIGYPKFRNKYPEFGPWDISSHGHRRDRSISVSNRRLNKRAQVHPLYSLSHLAKFKGHLPWTVEESSETDAKVRACLEGKASVEEILTQEITMNQHVLGELEYALQRRGSTGFHEKFRQAADNAYRTMYMRFSRRGNKMPTPPKDWRKRCFEEISNQLAQRTETKEISQNLVGKQGAHK